MPHPEEIYGIAVEGGTLFGALPQEKKLPESVARHFFTVLGDVCLNELDTSSASAVIVVRFLDSTGGAAWPFSVGTVVSLISSASKDCQIDSSLSLVVHGRSSFAESLVWLFTFLCALE